MSISKVLLFPVIHKIISAIVINGFVWFLAALGGDWTHLLDPTQRTAIDFGVYGVPETFFISADGQIARKQVGPVTWDVVKPTLDSLIASQTPAAAAAGGAP